MSNRLVIGGPTLDRVPASFAMDLAQLYARTKASGTWSDVVLMFAGATYVHVGREHVLDAAVNALRAEWMLWLDTDMSVPADTAIRLAKHGKPIVACNCVMKCDDTIWTAKRDGARVSSDDAEGIEPVESVGMAVMLMRTDVVSGWSRPWFTHGWNARTQQDIGEDVFFCQRVREQGHTVYVDHDLSKEIGHIGSYVYRSSGRHCAPVAV